MGTQLQKLLFNLGGREYGSYLTIVLQSRQSVLTAEYYLNFVAVRQPKQAKYWMSSSALGITGS